jgi:hypothetical protein
VTRKPRAESHTLRIGTRESNSTSHSMLLAPSIRMEIISTSPTVRAPRQFFPRGPKPSTRVTRQRRAESHSLRIGARDSLFTTQSPPVADRSEWKPFLQARRQFSPRSPVRQRGAESRTLRIGTRESLFHQPQRADRPSIRMEIISVSPTVRACR